jgi:cyclic pyranopterin monophosphate synthase
MKKMGDFSHLDSEGRPAMVNVGQKKVTHRTARAQALIHMPDEIMAHFNGSELMTKKGGVFQTAILAGIMASKRTGELIPLCHPLGLENCHIDIEISGKNTLIIIAETSITAKTGVEMEALTAASVAALTVYDMCKALSHDIVISEIKLLSKTGGKHDYQRG